MLHHAGIRIPSQAFANPEINYRFDGKQQKRRYDGPQHSTGRLPSRPPRVPNAPLANPLVESTAYRGGCIWLGGNGGAKKTTLSTYLAGRSTTADLSKFDIILAKQCTWNPTIPVSERCGVLSQQTALLARCSDGRRKCERRLAELSQGRH